MVLRLLSRMMASFSVLMCALLLTLPSLASAQTDAAHIRAALPEARIQGKGAFTWFGLKIYEITLWSGNPSLTPQELTTRSFALDLRYARKLFGGKIAEASIDEIKKIGVGTAAQHSAWLASMKALFPDVAKGTHLTGLYVPGQPTRFFLDGVPLGEVPDPEFGPAFFAIWLHPKTSEPPLRRALLGMK